MKSQTRLVVTIVTAVLAASLAPGGSSPAAAQEQPPQPPQPAPTPYCDVVSAGTFGEIQTAEGVQIQEGFGFGHGWTDRDPHCRLRNVSGRLTRLVEFSLTSEYEVTINLKSSDADTHLSLLDAAGQVIAVDDDGGSGTNSRIMITLAAGAYLVEVALDIDSETGVYEVHIEIGLDRSSAPTARQQDPGSSFEESGPAVAPPPPPPPVAVPTDCERPRRGLWSWFGLCPLAWSIRQQPESERTSPQPESEGTDCDKPSGDKYEKRRDAKEHKQGFLGRAKNAWAKLTAEHRVFALQAFTTIDGARVTVGTKGGEVQHDHLNLSQSGCSWIAFGAKANSKTRVLDNALVKEHAEILNQGTVSGNAQVYGHARVYDDADVFGYAHVYGHARVYEDAEVSGLLRCTIMLGCMERTRRYRVVLGSPRTLGCMETPRSLEL